MQDVCQQVVQRDACDIAGGTVADTTDSVLSQSPDPREAYIASVCSKLSHLNAPAAALLRPSAAMMSLRLVLQQLSLPQFIQQGRGLLGAAFLYASCGGFKTHSYVPLKLGSTKRFWPPLRKLS